MDEMTLRQEHNPFYRWGKKGKTPHVKLRRDVRTHVSFFGGLSLKTKKEFVYLSDRQNTTELINFLEIIKNKYQKEITQELPKHLERLEKLKEESLSLNLSESAKGKAKGKGRKEEEEFYEGLIPVFLDGAGFHGSQELKDYLSQNYGIFELMRFPTYSPDLNPQEHVWKALRKHLAKVEEIYKFI